MKSIKPIKIGAQKTNPNEKLTAAELGKLWATYMGNSMSKKILSYFLQHVEDEEIKKLVENALALSKEFMKSTEEFFSKEGCPIPIGFTDEDVNLGAPRLFEDEFYVHYLKYTAKAGLSIYGIAIPLMMREDIRDFFIHCNHATIKLIGEVNDILMKKGFIIKPPTIPMPEKVKFVKKQNFLNGYIGHIRPLHGLEITHLYDMIENNSTSKALLIAFSQVAKSEKVRDLFLRGRDITSRDIERYSHQLHANHLPSPSSQDHLVTKSTFSPFSDKIMVFHKLDMFSMKIRSVGNGIAVNGRHDIAAMFSKSLINISLFVEDAAGLLIENRWMEQPPEALDRDELSSSSK